jgi:uncharacterized protein (DUF1015 family)
VTSDSYAAASGLSLAPFRALRPAVGDDRLGHLLCPPYDVIDDVQRAALLEQDADNAVALILPRADDGADPYLLAAERLEADVASKLLAADAAPAMYVYEMRTDDGSVTRGLLGAVELRDPADGVILPHENTMAGPVADRLALMSATQANLEPIYLVYDGGGAASKVISDVQDADVIASAETPDGTSHRLWAITDPTEHAAVEADLATRHALIADGHHRYATYRQLQHDLRSEHGAGPWDRGLALLVDSSSYGPQVHAIHRVLVGVPLSTAVDQAAQGCDVQEVENPLAALDAAARVHGFAMALTDGVRTWLVTDPAASLVAELLTPGEPAALADLDVTVLHRAFVERIWHVPDTAEAVGYAHSIDEAIAEAGRSNGTAVLLRATPVEAVAAVAAAGARMPRKSTLFTPKPASGLVMRRFIDQM